ncbi:hypothetical protein Dimus_033647 [Dionaea muscipula]
MSEVADVGEEEAPTEGAVSGTQESEVVVSKRKPKPKAKRKKKDVVACAKEKTSEESNVLFQVVEPEIVKKRNRDENVRRLAADSDVNKEE